MGARRKLNVVFLNGGLLLAALCGLITRSWSGFAIALAVLLAGCAYSGEIRPAGRRR